MSVASSLVGYWLNVLREEKRRLHFQEPPHPNAVPKKCQNTTVFAVRFHYFQSQHMDMRDLSRQCATPTPLGYIQARS